MKGKIFTRQEATRMLPLLRRIVTDAKACTKLIDRLERSQDDEPAESPAAVKSKLKRLHGRLKACRKELEELGCFLDDPREGTIKFYGEINSRIVYYTWRLGEPEVSFWYPIEKSFGDRQPIDDVVAENASGL